MTTYHRVLPTLQALSKASSLILLSIYYKQKSNVDDFLEIIQLLLHRLLKRGYEFEALEPIFKTSIVSIEQKANKYFKKISPDSITTTTANHTSDKQLFLYLPYHPKDISRKRLCNISDAFYKPTL